MTQIQQYNYGSPGSNQIGSLARTSTNTYLNSSNYTSRYILNRLTTVTVTDPAGKYKTFTMDALGNLTQVQESDPSLGTVSTTYSYDMLSHLTQVSMPRGSTTQTRTFNYTSGATVGAVLLSATNPENGTVTYTYNSDMTLASKTDAKGQQFTYSYDSYKRLTSVSVGGTLLRTYVYDSNPDDSSYSQYAAGRLTEIKYPAINYTVSGANASTTFTDMFSYSQAGQIAGKRLRVSKTQTITATGDLNLSYTHNGEGKLTSVTYPFDSNTNTTPSYTYSYDSLVRPSGATDQSNSQVVSGVQYNVANQLTAISYYAATETRSYNNLLQLTNITTSAPGVPANGLNVTYNYGDLARNKTATQSSTYAPGTSDASKAVDGNTDGAYQDGSVTATNNDSNAWWQVDLGASASVSSIVVWNRTDCCADRLSDYWVFVSDTPFGPTDTPATLQNRAGTWSSHQTVQPSPSTVITIPGAQGRYVRVQLSGTNYLSLAEVQVYGALSGTIPPGLVASNNGKVNSMYDAISGEAVTYQYDSLNRLISASGSGWTQTQTYDGFGNLTGRTGTGTAQSTTISTPADPTTNRLTGYGYDSNGNQISTGYSYDAENRIATANAGAIEYFYDGQNKRIWQASFSGGSLIGDTITLFGADGRQVANYQPQVSQTTITFTMSGERVYFGGRLVAQQIATGAIGAMVTDRLGSTAKYYPYGEQRDNVTQPSAPQLDFATYTRDSATLLDYADQRYYSSALGRFMTPDPSHRSAAIASPTTLNRYSYSWGDPANNNDPTGLLTIILPGAFSGCGTADFQPGSGFYNSVEQTFGEAPVCFDWSGVPLRGAFSAAGDDLVNFVNQNLKPGDPLNIVAHSDGGNVVKDYTQQGGHYIDNLVTLGTPQILGVDINCNDVGNYVNVYSTNDLIQPLQFINGYYTIFIEVSLDVLGDIFGIDDYVFNSAPLYYSITIPIILAENLAGRTDPAALNIDLSDVPGVGAVGHSDLHTAAVWNAMLQQLSASGYSFSNPASIRGACH